LPAEHGNTRDLTQTSNADEDHPTWSPDGKTIAYTTDISGEQQIAVRPAEGGAEKILTHFERGSSTRRGGRQTQSGLHSRTTSIACGGCRWLVASLFRSHATCIPKSTITRGRPTGAGSHTASSAPNQQSGIWLYNTETRKASLVSDPRSNDFQPAFDPAGSTCSFISTRHENPTFSRTEFNIATLKMTGIYVATLKRGAASPFAPQSDEGVGEGRKDEKDRKDERKKEDRKPEPKPLEIDLDGLMARSVPMPIPPADISTFDVRDEKVSNSPAPAR